MYTTSTDCSYFCPEVLRDAAQKDSYQDDSEFPRQTLRKDTSRQRGDSMYKVTEAKRGCDSRSEDRKKQLML